MKATFSFDMNDYDERREFFRMGCANDLCCIISEFGNSLRTISKNDVIDGKCQYRGKEFNSDTIDNISELFHQLVNEECPQFDEIW